MFSWRCFPFVESAPRAYRLKASNAAPLSSTSAGTFPGGAEHRYSDVNPLRLRLGLVDRPIALSLRKIGHQPTSTPTGSERIDCAVHGTNLGREALLSFLRPSLPW